LGLPAISIPCGVNPDGLPIGIQLIGHWSGDHAVLNAAHAYERAERWNTRLAVLG
jgi:Asp-tRNA(Asn)/Glu-tRNA(Gln) amidotransferase A subunit family amidase